MEELLGVARRGAVLGERRIGERRIGELEVGGQRTDQLVGPVAVDRQVAAPGLARPVRRSR
ncbi:MAG: hypothetical protein M3071_20110 [Actinomycetota bacterium]|nr:hypothetical protein [Actinomycetota bacterium]